MRLWGVALLAAACLACAPRPATSQEPDAGVSDVTDLRSGDTIRVEAPSLVYRRAEGRLLSRSADSLRIDTGAGPGGPAGGALPGSAFSVALSDVERLRVRRGSHDARWRGVVVGTPLGFVVGVAVDEETRDDHEAVRSSIRAGGLVGGAVLGWLVGRMIEVDRWVEVSPGEVGRAGAAALGVRVPLPRR